MLKKFIVATILSVVLLFGIFNGIQDKAFWNLRAKSWWRDGLEAERIKNDTHGGETPQETLDLFIEALENRDFELASKYFVIEEQKDWQLNLSSSTQDEILILIDNLSKLELESQRDDEAFYFVFVRTEDFGFVKSRVDLQKNTRGLWKIKRL